MCIRDSITASNILFTFEPEAVENSPVFTTANGSNSVVVNSLAPGASEVLTMKFTSSPSAEQRAYNITITEQYDSPEFKNAKETVKTVSYTHLSASPGMCRSTTRQSGC